MVHKAALTVTSIVLFVEEGYQRNPEKGEAEARKSETSGQKSERNVRDRLKTMDPKKAEAMKKQMRAVGLNV